MSSTVLDEAARIARQFDYPADDVRRGVAEYMREMEEGLVKEGTTLSQIPTFVTEVPNGSEKVSFLFASRLRAKLTGIGSVPGSRPRRHQLPRVLH